MNPVIWLIAAVSYFSMYSSDSQDALNYFDHQSKEFDSQTVTLTPKQRKIAAAIVAPEVSQYNHVLDFVQLRSLYFTYIYQGVGDFSVGRFQMKPSFLEYVEKNIDQTPELRKKYSAWLTELKAAPDDKARRRIRLERLEEDYWQMRYLTLFMELAEKRCKNRVFDSDDEKVRHFATLYNSGLHITDAKAAQMKTRKLFPHDKRTHNYADIAVEFFHRLKI
ncbi:MAG: hypothetical protein NC201_03035 [Prevotella sp.]|nr:hypothetical protein [Bacteroides sp.]MCM1366201.1 hypothetical protein [Prevotella sp.]MCM1436953.1 hypothetical protein [Prevotella sp.]